MAEYIEREKAYEKCGWYNTVNGKSICAARKDELAAIPSADVAPVRHAKWEECHWVEQDGPYSLVAHPKAAFRCSGCKYVFKKELLWKDNYCPNCGCRMDLEG